jgi:glycosyltransferase involved in cell wall biosynthesis
MKTVLYISTNNIWSGSEELWTRSAAKFADGGYTIHFATRYTHANLNALKAKREELYQKDNRKSLRKRLLAKTGLIKTINATEFFLNALKKISPNLVIVSQGNNIDSIEVMGHCQSLQIPYITLTQLVAEVHYLFINKNNLERLQQGYLNAKRNFFVSHQNLRLNNEMLGISLPNAEVVHNPCKLSGNIEFSYPRMNVIKIALIGRLECYHKGYDVLLQVISSDKWRNRPIQFNLFGTGPHEDILRMNIEREKLNNIFLMGHASDVENIWKEHHMLLLPSRFEGQALVLIEAMWCGRPAIVTDAGGAIELIEEDKNGFIAEAPTSKFLDDAMERAWNKRDQWEEMGKSAAATIRQKYPPDTIAFFNSKILELL